MNKLYYVFILAFSIPLWLWSMQLQSANSTIDPINALMPDWEFTTGIVSHTIVIEDIPDLDVGDYIGFFYEENGVWQCAGFTEWIGQSMALLIYGNESGEETTGFNPGELINNMRVWKPSNGEEYYAYPTFVEIGENPIVDATDGFSDGGLSVISNLEIEHYAQLDLTVFLEGPFDGIVGGNGTMNADLADYFPLEQPYNTAPYYYYGLQELDTAPTPNDGIIDWLLIELRTGTPDVTTMNTTVVATKTVLLLEDGSIANADGRLPEFLGLNLEEDYYVCVRHRNHLDVLSATPIAASNTMNYDFSTSSSTAFGTAQLKELESGVFGLYGGDFNRDGTIQSTDFDLWKLAPAINGIYGDTDANLDGTVQNTDRDLWFLNRSKLGIAEIRF